MHGPGELGRLLGARLDLSAGERLSLDAQKQLEYRTLSPSTPFCPCHPPCSLSCPSLCLPGSAASLVGRAKYRSTPSNPRKHQVAVWRAQGAAGSDLAEGKPRRARREPLVLLRFSSLQLALIPSCSIRLRFLAARPSSRPFCTPSFARWFQAQPPSPSPSQQLHYSAHHEAHTLTGLTTTYESSVQEEVQALAIDSSHAPRFLTTLHWHRLTATRA